MAGEAPEVTKESIQSSDIDEIARELYNRADPTGIFAAADYIIQAHFRKEAQRLIDATQRAIRSHV